MSNSFKPNFVPSDVVARWPAMAFALWKQSFRKQAAVLLLVALWMKFFPDWAPLAGFLLAPSVFVVSFAIVQLTDEDAVFSWMKLMENAMPGAVRLGGIAIQFAACFGIVFGILFYIASLLKPRAASVHADGELLAQLAGSQAAPLQPAALTGMPGEFFYFCASWAEGVMSLVFLGLFIVAIYQGIFGVVLHAQQGMHSNLSRQYGWQAWQVNSSSIEQAFKDAPLRFYMSLAGVAAAVVCAFQTVYLSPVGLLLATYIPSLAYVAYRSIFFGKHENVPVARRASSSAPRILIPAWQQG